MLNSPALFSNLVQTSCYFLCYLISIRKKMMSNPFGSRRMMGIAPLEQVDLQKSFLMYPSISVCCAANKHRGQPFLWDSEFSSVDWERGTFKSCSLSQRHGNCLHSRNSPCPVVRKFGTKADSRREVLFLPHRKFINSQLSDSIRLLTANSS